MLIPCPFCGPRQSGEFSYLGDASPKRPLVAAEETGDDVEEAFYDYVYLRDNVAGEMREYWYHGGGCRAWLIVVRNTLTHTIASAEAAPGAGAGTAAQSGA